MDQGSPQHGAVMDQGSPWHRAARALALHPPSPPKASTRVCCRSPLRGSTGALLGPPGEDAWMLIRALQWAELTQPRQAPSQPCTHPPPRAVGSRLDTAASEEAGDELSHHRVRNITLAPRDFIKLKPLIFIINPRGVQQQAGG